MSPGRIKMLQKSRFQVCRFCLHENSKELDSIYDKIEGGARAINPTIEDVLTMLQIQIPVGDSLPKLVCINCRDSLMSIFLFRKNALRSLDLLEKAMETKPDDLLTANASDEEDTVNRESSLEETIEALEPDFIGDDNPVEAQKIIDVKEEHNVATTSLSQDQIKEEEYLEEDFLDEDGYIPVQDDGHIVVLSKYKEPKPKTRKPPTAKVCTICGAKSTAMAVHMRTHTNDRPFPCTMCDLKFYTNGKLRCHFDSVHVGERKFSCEICGKSFVLKKNLKAHLMSHSAKREHACSQCSKSFLFKWSLTAHERIHSGERPYECSWPGCGKRFVTVSNLIQHQKTTNHWKEAPEEKCPLCGKAFQTKAALKAHHTKTHGS